MPTDPIDYVTAYYGDPAWNVLEIIWDGTGATFDLIDESDESTLYSGALKAFTFTADPGTRHSFRVETTVAMVDYTMRTRATLKTLLAPINVRVGTVTEDEVTVDWDAVAGVDGYEIADVTDGYTIVATIGSGATITHTFTGLDASTRHSYAVRSEFNGQYSRWSAPATAFTLAPTSVVAGVYTYQPLTVFTWQAGRAGSTSPEWEAATEDWFHGDGFVWGDDNGVQTTYFFFGAVNPFNDLDGGTPTKLEVYLERAQAGGDPAVVLSRWGLHGYATKPVGEPAAVVDTSDAGSFARGDTGWVELPLGWAAELISGVSLGICWGGVAERYQKATNRPYGADPRTGDVRVTVS